MLSFFRFVFNIIIWLAITRQKLTDLEYLIQIAILIVIIFLLSNKKNPIERKLNLKTALHRYDNSLLNGAIIEIRFQQI